MVFIIRLRTPLGTKRLAFESPAVATLAQLQQQVADLTGVAIPEQRLSTTPLSRPTFLIGSSSDTLQKLGLTHGDMLHLESSTEVRDLEAERRVQAEADKAAKAKARAASASASGLTPHCQHGRGGRCLHCSARVNDASTKDDVAEWLCNHPESAFCPKCLPPEEVDPDAESEAKKSHFVPYRHFMAERKAACKYRHNATQMCPFCMDPPVESYVGKKGCRNAHRPWPYGVCLTCAPPNAHLRLQKYRHCDAISFQDVRCLHNFYREWASSNREEQRVGILFGAYLDEPSKRFLDGAVRADVHSLYVPPQATVSTGVRFLRDKNEELTHKVAQWLGLEPVGWVITTTPRTGDKYGGQVIMSGSEVRQAARLQHKYRDEHDHSRFVTVIMEHGEQVEPRAYHVSDQCMALERDRILALSSDPYMITTRKPKAHELVPTVVYKNKPLEPGTEFLPDEFIIPVVVGAQANPSPLFRHCEFPSGALSDPGITSVAVQEFFRTHASEEYESKLSDFNLLCCLYNYFNPEVVEQVCTALGRREMFSVELRTKLDEMFAAKQLFF